MLSLYNAVIAFGNNTSLIFSKQQSSIQWFVHNLYGHNIFSVDGHGVRREGFLMNRRYMTWLMKDNLIKELESNLADILISLTSHN